MSEERTGSAGRKLLARQRKVEWMAIGLGLVPVLLVVGVRRGLIGSSYPDYRVGIDLDSLVSFSGLLLYVVVAAAVIGVTLGLRPLREADWIVAGLLILPLSGYSFVMGLVLVCDGDQNCSPLEEPPVIRSVAYFPIAWLLVWAATAVTQLVRQHRSGEQESGDAPG